MFQRTSLLSACENSRELQRTFTSEHLLFEPEFQERQQQLILPEEMPQSYHQNHKALLISYMASKQKRPPEVNFGKEK